MHRKSVIFEWKQVGLVRRDFLQEKAATFPLYNKKGICSRQALTECQCILLEWIDITFPSGIKRLLFLLKWLHIKR